MRSSNRQTNRLTNRGRAREIALQVLFQGEFRDEAAFELYDDRDKESLGYAKYLVEGVRRNHQQLDQLIEQKSLHWKITRMPLVDKNILRLASFELLFGEDITVATIIDEAVELAKKFGQTESSSFINGVLDQIAKQQRASS
jgi:N utilization substance protein B